MFLLSIHCFSLPNRLNGWHAPVSDIVLCASMCRNKGSTMCHKRGSTRLLGDVVCSSLTPPLLCTEGATLVQVQTYQSLFVCVSYSITLINQIKGQGYSINAKNGQKHRKFKVIIEVKSIGIGYLSWVLRSSCVLGIFRYKIFANFSYLAILFIFSA